MLRRLLVQPSPRVSSVLIAALILCIPLVLVSGVEHLVVSWTVLRRSRLAPMAPALCVLIVGVLLTLRMRDAGASAWGAVKGVGSAGALILVSLGVGLLELRGVLALVPLLLLRAAAEEIWFRVLLPSRVFEAVSRLSGLTTRGKRVVVTVLVAQGGFSIAHLILGRAQASHGSVVLSLIQLVATGCALQAICVRLGLGATITVHAAVNVIILTPIVARDGAATGAVASLLIVGVLCGASAVHPRVHSRSHSFKEAT